MKRLNLILVILLLGACSGQVKEAPETTVRLQQHDAALTNISNYLGQLIEKKILPKPEFKKEK